MYVCRENSLLIEMIGIPKPKLEAGIWLSDPLEQQEDVLESELDD